MANILVIPDGHAHPDYSNERFDWLGEYIMERKPDVIVNIGDLADMPSLSSFDRGTKGFEGRRYLKDIAAVVDAQERLFAPMDRYNANKRAWREKQYKPRLILTLGNHEYRIERATNGQAELDGVIGLHDLRYEEFGWEVIPFQQPVVIDGISFCHYHTSGVMNRPIGGENIGASLIKKGYQSAVQGHSHVYDHSERTRHDGDKVFGMSVGCYTHPKMIEGWNRGCHQMWWRGVVEINETDGNGYYDELRQVTMRKLRRMYG